MLGSTFVGWLSARFDVAAPFSGTRWALFEMRPRPHRIREGLKCRCKVKDKELYKMILDVHNRYTTDDMLRRVFHKFSSQGNEALNQSVCKNVPKTRTIRG
jgi:hypothetical protein